MVVRHHVMLGSEPMSSPMAISALTADASLQAQLLLLQLLLSDILLQQQEMPLLQQLRLASNASFIQVCFPLLYLWVWPECQGLI